eukprot:14274300-Alexandrium_andersonii.AAC.1
MNADGGTGTKDPPKAKGSKEGSDSAGGSNRSGSSRGIGDTKGENSSKGSGKAKVKAEHPQAKQAPKKATAKNPPKGSENLNAKDSDSLSK